MAKKGEFIVIDGCIQEGRETFLPGSVYTPPTTKLRDELLEAGVIAPVKDPVAQAAIRAAEGRKPQTPSAPDLLTPPASDDNAGGTGDEGGDGADGGSEDAGGDGVTGD
ncbi:hypothetical protein [Pseudomonas sp. LFM046]|uniref:hypothetical protein n=1 Tax=Pseudomonas sp. LFM046 TaxID=1608357 RepID=UPI0005CFE00E|nr:hypothetical protein [Pseudomonas sp. LFM046]